MKGNMHPVTGRVMGRRRTTGHYGTTEALEEAIAKTLTETPDLSWLSLGIRHGISATTARNIARQLVVKGRIHPFPGSVPVIT